MRKLLPLLAVLVLLLAAAGVRAQQGVPPGGYNQNSGAGTPAAGPGQIIVSPLCPASNANNCYFVHDDVKACYDGTVTASSNVVTSAGQCVWTAADIGKKIFATTNSSAGGSGNINYGTSIAILPSQTAVCTIASLNNANSINTNGTCYPSQTYNTYADLIYGTDDTANLNAAWAGQASLNQCGTVILPQGMMFFDAQIFTAIPAYPLNTCNAYQGQTSGTQNYPQVGWLGATVQGCGPGCSVLVPTPDMNWTKSAVCGSIIGCAEETLFQNFGINGFGQAQTSGGALAGTILLTATGAMAADTVFCTGWENRNANATGIYSGGYGYFHNIVALGCGGTNIEAGGSQQMTNLVVGFFATTAIKIDSIAVNFPVQISNLFVWDCGYSCGASKPDVTLAGDLQLTNGEIHGGFSNSSIFQVNSGGKLHLNNFSAYNDNAGAAWFSIASGGTVYSQGFDAGTETATPAVQNAGTFVSECGNTMAGPVAGAGVSILCATDAIGVPTITGTGACSTIGSQLPTATGVNPLSGSLACTGSSGAATLTFTWAAVAPHGYICPLPRDVTTGADVFTFTSSSATACVYGAAAIVTNDVITWGVVGQY